MLFGSLEDVVVGVAVCVWSFSTFAGKPSVNLDDFSVLPEAQSCGVRSALIAEVEARSRARGAAKITLEVISSNREAMRLYEKSGFELGEPSTLFMTRRL